MGGREDRDAWSGESHIVMTSSPRDGPVTATGESCREWGARCQSHGNTKDQERPQVPREGRAGRGHGPTSNTTVNRSERTSSSKFIHTAAASDRCAGNIGAGATDGGQAGGQNDQRGDSLLHDVRENPDVSSKEGVNIR